MNSKQQYIREALSLLGIDRLVLAIHDQSFPSLPEEEIGRGTPYSFGGKDFARFVSELGFSGIQFGPQGKTTLINPSPYDSTLFSKNDLSISLLSLATDQSWQGRELLDPAFFESLQQQCPAITAGRDRNSYTYAWHAQHTALHRAYERFINRRGELQNLWSSFQSWVKNNDNWLKRDGLFEVLSIVYNTDDWSQWSVLDQRLAGNAQISVAGRDWFTSELEKIQAGNRIARLQNKRAKDFDFYNFCQFIAHQQHNDFRELAANLNLKLYADLQIGFSTRDIWALRHLFLPDYLLGAPPSRTNPDGQPWGYPVLDPDLYFEAGSAGQPTTGAAMRLFTSRIDKLLQDFDGLRIDHPHGIICPWVYKAAESDALKAVQNGARLFESPNIAEHPQLAKYAIALQEQLAGSTGVSRYADGWVTQLADAQIEKYAMLVQVIKERLHAHGFASSGLICEVLSSCPYPLKRVLQKYELGRFRVTQKAQPLAQEDVYRSDNAEALDWIMVGTHDTKPIWLVADSWSEAERQAWAQYLAHRLEPLPSQRESTINKLVNSQASLVEAMFADLFIGPARNVSIFFSDLLGIKEVYNEPGIVSDTNWVLSVPNNYRQIYQEKISLRQALNLPRVLSIALRAKLFPNAGNEQIVALIEKLEELAAKGSTAQAAL